MGNLISATSILFRAQIAGILRARRTLVCALLALIPVALALLVVQIARKEEDPAPVVEIGWLLQVQVLVPILALILGSAAVAGEVEDRTITYLFTRPIPRASVLIGRWLATLLVLYLLMIPSTIAMLAVLHTGIPFGVGSALPEGVIGPLLGAVVLGSAVYSGLFASAGTFVKYPMIVGLGYVFAVETLLSNLPGSTQGLTLQYYLRSFVVAYGSDAWGELEIFNAKEWDTGTEAITTLVVTLLVALAVGCWTVSRKQYVLSS